MSMALSFLLWYYAIGAFIIFGLFAKTTMEEFSRLSTAALFWAVVFILTLWLPGLVYYANKK
jgi:hypothetical protein